jgi:pimeloyl-ACP methyl ester carboxylesterase
MPKSILSLVLAALLSQWCVAAELKSEFNGLVLNALYEDQGTGPVVLMLHGTLAHNDMDVMRGLREALAENGLSTLAINLSLGLDDRHGMFDCTRPHRHLHTDAIKEIEHWVDWLRSRGRDRIVLLGHSRGGNQVAWYLSEHPDPAVRAALLLAPMTWSERPAAEAYASQAGRPLAAVLDEARAHLEQAAGPRMINATSFLHCAEATVSPESFLSYYAPDPRFDTPSLAPSLGVPLLLVAGTEDPVVPGLIPAFEALEPSERRRLLVLDGADHFFRDLYAYDIAEALAAFLADRGLQ